MRVRKLAEIAIAMELGKLSQKLPFIQGRETV